MSLYTKILDEKNKKTTIILNRNYTKEQIREIMSKSNTSIFIELGTRNISIDVQAFSSMEIAEVLEEGIYIPENENRVIEPKGRVAITTELRGGVWYARKGYKIEIYPDARYIIRPKSVKERVVALFKR